jgi:hypothetical protein
MIVVSDATPISRLLKVDQATLLKKLFDTVINIQVRPRISGTRLFPLSLREQTLPDITGRSPSSIRPILRSAARQTVLSISRAPDRFQADSQKASDQAPGAADTVSKSGESFTIHSRTKPI